MTTRTPDIADQPPEPPFTEGVAAALSGQTLSDGDAALLAGPPIPEGVGPEAFAAFGAFIRLGRAHRQHLGSLAGPEGGHPAQAGCIRILSRRDGISQRDLARYLFLAPPSVTTMLQRMERAGIVIRRPDSTDQRLVTVHLTDRGRALGDRVHAGFASHLSRMFEGFSADELVQLESLLGRMADNITRATE